MKKTKQFPTLTDGILMIYEYDSRSEAIYPVTAYDFMNERNELKTFGEEITVQSAISEITEVTNSILIEMIRDRIAFEGLPDEMDLAKQEKEREMSCQMNS